MSFFGTVLTTLVTLLHVYVFVRLDSLFLFRRRMNRWVLIGSGAGLWLMFVLSRMYGGDDYGLLSMSMDLFAMHWMGSVFLVAVAVFVADMACGFGFLFRNAARRIRAVGLVCGVILVVIAHTQGLRAPKVERYEVAVKGLPAALDGTTVAVMTDLHVGEMFLGAGWLKARVDQVRELRPDCVVLVGDLFERGADPAEIAPVMRGLSAPLGVWAVRGNHDSLRAGRRDVAGEILADAGIPLLGNEWVRLADGLVLAGIEDLTSSRRRPGEGEGNIERALTGRPNGVTILLSHTPWMTDRAAAAGVDVMVSGHTHNGQIWPFNHLVRTRYPHVGGRYDIGALTLVVCRGTGSWGPRMRLWPRGEISLLSLSAN